MRVIDFWDKSSLSALNQELQMTIYRLVLDENGQEDCRDFTVLEDAYQEFMKAKRRGAFSARVDGYDSYTHQFIQTVHRFEKSE